MGLRVSDFNMDMIKGKRIVDYSFKTGSEYVIYVVDKNVDNIDDVPLERVRIPADLANMFEDFLNIY